MSHAVEMYEALPNAELAVVPGTSHFLTQEKPQLVNELVLDFLTNEPVPAGGADQARPRAGLSTGNAGSVRPGMRLVRRRR